MAQWIEQFRPKEEVVRSTRTRVTNFELESPIWAIFCFRSVNDRASNREITHLYDPIFEIQVFRLFEKVI